MWCRAESLDGIERHEEHGYEVSEKDEEVRKGVRGEGRFFQGLPVDHVAWGFWLWSGLSKEEERNGDAAAEELDEAEDADGPGEADAWLEADKDNGKYDAAYVSQISTLIVF